MTTKILRFILISQPSTKIQRTIYGDQLHSWCPLQTFHKIDRSSVNKLGIDLIIPTNGVKVFFVTWFQEQPTHAYLEVFVILL